VATPPDEDDGRIPTYVMAVFEELDEIVAEKPEMVLHVLGLLFHRAAACSLLMKFPLSEEEFLSCARNAYRIGKKIKDHPGDA
jgi:hypothetical protein